MTYDDLNELGTLLHTAAAKATAPEDAAKFRRWADACFEERKRLTIKPDHVATLAARLRERSLLSQTAHAGSWTCLSCLTDAAGSDVFERGARKCPKCGSEHVLRFV